MNHSDFSCIKQVVKTVHLTLPPSYISNEIAGVTEILENWKRQYVHQLQGVVVNYKNISLASRMGFIHISKAHVHYDVTATFDLFCPSVGDIVKGKINRTSPEHIGCLIEGTINVTIHMPDNTSGALSKFIKLNQEVLFQITHFGFNRNTIRVNGQITHQCIELMENLFLPFEEKNKSIKKSAKLRNSAMDQKSDSESSNDELSNELQLFTSNYCQTNSNAVKSSSESNSDVESESFKKPSEKNIDVKDVLKSLKMVIQTDPENNSVKESCMEVNKFKSSKKRKRESDSFESTESSEGKTVKYKKLKQEIMSPITASKTPLTEKSPKKKHKEKLKSFSSEKLNHNSKLDLHRINSENLESTFANFDFSDHISLLKNIKEEAISPRKSTIDSAKGKKRKRESSTSDIQENSLTKQKKHKKKDSKASKEKNKDKIKSKPSSKKGKIITAGDVIKKDKKKEHKSKKNTEGKHKHKKKKSKKDVQEQSDTNLDFPLA